jgi:hypothetical protein
MKVKDFLNSFAGLWDFVTILEYIGDTITGADPEEDYEAVGTYPAQWYIPETVKARTIEYFDISDGAITIWLQD